MTITLLHPSLLDVLIGYGVYLVSYIFIVGKIYETRVQPSRLVLVYIFMLGGPAIWLAYPLAKRSSHVQ